MRLFNIFLIFNILLFVNCSKKFTAGQDNVSLIEISNVAYSKIPPKYNTKLLSKITNNRAKNFSSSIGCIYEYKYIDFPINDQLFNHEYFINYDYNPDKKAILHLRRYVYNKKEYLIAIKIEDVK